MVTVAVVRRKKIGDKGVRLCVVVEIVRKLEAGVGVSAYEFFYREWGISGDRREERVLGCAFDGETGQRTPLRVQKVRLSISANFALIEPREQKRSACGLSQTAHISPRERNRATRAGVCGLAGCELITA